MVNSNYWSTTSTTSLVALCIQEKTEKRRYIYYPTLTFCGCLFNMLFYLAFHFAGRLKFNSETVALIKYKGEDLELPFFDFIKVATATNNFSLDNKIGEGGFGPVYKVN